MTMESKRNPSGIQADSVTYTHTRHYTYISTPIHDTFFLAPSHHVVQVGNASSVAPSPGTTPDVMMPEIDLNADLLCACSGCCGDHAHLADVIAQPTCECLGLFALCFQHVGNDRELGWLVTCDTCSAVLPAADPWRIVQVLR